MLFSVKTEEQMRRFQVALIAVIALAALTRGASAVEPMPVYNWTGFYSGFNAGWSWGKDKTTVNIPGGTTSFSWVPRPLPIRPLPIRRIRMV
jgi:hypothetical protein